MKALTEQQIDQHLEDLNGWDHHEDALHTAFEFDNFKDAFSVMTRIALEAEAMQHHPVLISDGGSLEIKLTTHDAGGVSEKDFEMARAIEHIVGEE